MLGAFKAWMFDICGADFKLNTKYQSYPKSIKNWRIRAKKCIIIISDTNWKTHEET